MPSDADTPHPNSRVIPQAFEEATEGTPSLSNPLQLFTADDEQVGGDLSALSPPRASRNDNNKHGPPPKSPAASSPNPKRPANIAVTATRSPFRRAAHRAAAAASAAASVFVTQLTQPIQNTIPTPSTLDEDSRDGPSPTSVLDSLFDAPVPPPKKSSSAAMIGLVPKSDFLRWGREWMYSTKEVYTEVQIKKQIQQCRTNMMYNFSKTYNNDRRGDINGYEDFVEVVEDESGPRTRSTVEEDEDEWMVDTSAVDLKVTDTRRLSLYPIEQLLLCKAKTRLLILIKESDVDLFGPHAPMIASSQGTTQMVISGHRYFRLKATIDDDLYHINARGEGLRYTQSTFENDFKTAKGEFSVRFDGTVYTHRFNWRDVVANSSSIKFFGAPLSMTRSFGKIFKDVSDLNKLYHRFISFYNEFEGDANSCLSIYNSYMSRKLIVFQNKLSKSEKKATKSKVDKDLFTTQPVKDFLQDIDDTFLESQERVFTKWTIHSEPIVDTDVMKKYIKDAADVFGSFWQQMIGLRGVRPKRVREKDQNVARTHSVFFQILGLARMANRQRLQNYAFVQNVTNYARGVGRSAEMAIAYHGQTVSNATRRRRFAHFTGNDNEGRASGNTLKDKQSRLLRTCRAVMLCYDNYQKGLTLQHQRGSHSSAFFKGTHQCGHKIFEFDDDTFDAFYPQFTQHDQAIPSPWGMPAFEMVDFEDPVATCNVYENFDTYITLATPEFEGKRVDSYIQLRDTASHLTMLARAFPASAMDDDNGYFDQCPSNCSQENLRNFGAKLNSSRVAKLLKEAKAFQHNTVLRWNEHADEATMSVYLGLLGIDEAASKECGAITLDLLLRSGVLVQNEGGGWDLADDYKTRRIYLVGDAKTVENMTKFVRDMQTRRISYSTANVQSEIFLEALSVIKKFPGDWHTGLNMLI